jgi:hypothetical protein
MSVPNELRTQILALPRVDRAELAHDLLLSLDPDEPTLRIGRGRIDPFR